MAETKKHNKLINEQAYAALSDDLKKRAVRLNGGYYIVYPLELAQEKFKLSQDRANESENVQKTRRNEAKDALNREVTNNDFKVRNEQLDKFVVNGSSVLDKDWRLFKKASPEMDWVKKSMNALNSVLNESLEQYFENGSFKAEKYQARLDAAYDEFITAAENYCKVKNPSSRPGIRRKNRVAALLKRVKQMKLDSKSLVDAVKEGAVDFDHMTPETKQQLNSHNLVNQVTSSEVDISEWQNQGNSTDVYRVRLKASDGKFYYLKENLPFLNENIGGFLSRRYKQLETSLNNKNFNKAPHPGEDDKPVEERLLKISDKDYQNGMKVLDALSKDLEATSDDKRSAKEEATYKLFAHNFDDIFRKFEINNLAAHFIQSDSFVDIDTEIANAKNDPLRLAALKYAKSVLMADPNYKPGENIKDKFKEMTIQEWLTEKMGLDANEHKVFLKAIEGMDAKELETLFRVTMGKEVELFGQMSAQSIQTGTDKAAVNNTATSRVAEQLGFDDVITKSRTAMVKFTRRDGTEVNQLCTLCEEAPGTELVDLMKEAEKNGMKISYSSEAIRDLMRLHAIDTLCLQKDRHGRNFKCEVDRDEKTKTITIKSVKAYDNDMSFDAISLEKAFEKDPERVQFLPSMNTKITKGSALYKYVLGNFFGIDTVSPEKKAETPAIRLGSTNFVLREEHLGYGPTAIWKLMLNNDSAYSMGFSTQGMHDVAFRNPNAISENDKKSMQKEMEEMGIKFDSQDAKDCYSRYAVEKLIRISNVIQKNWLAGDPEKVKNGEFRDSLKNIKPRDFTDKALKKQLTYEERIELAKAIDELKKLDKQFDFSVMRTTGSFYSEFDAYIKSIIFLHDVAYGDTLDNRIMFQNENYQAIKQLMDGSGNLVIPNMLHYDNEAHQALQKKVNAYADPNSEEVRKLKETGLSDEKIKALAERDREMLKDIEIAKTKAELFYKAAGWKLPDPRAKFFLEKEDYKKIGKLTDYAIDPGKSYLAVDNENFLCGQSFKMKVDGKMQTVKFTDLMDENEKKAAQNYNEYIKNDEKRWKYKPEEKQNKVYDNNNTKDGLANAENGKEYIRCCREDEIYNIAHKAIRSKEELSGKVWNALFLNSLVYQTDQYENPLSLETAHKLMTDLGKAKEGYQKVLDSTVGKMYKAKIDSAIDKKFADQSFKKFDTASFKLMNEKALEHTMTDVFKKLTEPEPNAEKIAKYARKTESMAKQFGVELNAEKAFAAFIKKNPGISAELQNAVKNAGLKPEVKAPEVKASEVKNPQADGPKVGENKKTEIKQQGGPVPGKH